jgi:uncharacterized protein (DUF2461 family)
MKTAISWEEIAADLIHIHEERTRVYQQALRGTGKLSLDIKSIYERIIEESRKYAKQLYKKIGRDIQFYSNLYQSWQGAKIREGGRKEILAGVLDEQVAMMNIYSTALASADGDPEITDVLVTQQEGEKKLYEHIKQYHDAQ